MSPPTILAAIVVSFVSLVNGVSLPGIAPAKNVLSSSNPERLGCPCSYDATSVFIDCSSLSLSKVPVDCFDLYPIAELVNLSYNNLTEILEHDFDVLRETVKIIDLFSNDIYYVHPRAFSKLVKLEGIDLSYNKLHRLPEELLISNEMLSECYFEDNNLVDLPLSLFSPNIKNNDFSISIYPNPLRSVPCSMTAPFGNMVFQDLSNFEIFWASTAEEAVSCISFGIGVNVSICRPFGLSGIDCSHLSEAMTPSKAAMAVAESRVQYYVPTKIVFKAELTPLMGAAPQLFSCLPDGVDLTETYRIYARHTKELVIETFFFDLLDLHRYTSHETQSVTIRADTVVLTGALEPLWYPLTIIARRVVLEKPLQVVADLNVYAPETVPSFFMSSHERGRAGNMIVEKLQHGLVTVLLLQGGSDPTDECQPLPDWTADAESWVKASQLWLSLYCANAVWEGGEVSQSQFALDIMDFVATLTTNWTTPAFVGINQRAVKAIQEANLKQEQRQLPRVVPYMTVPVYSDMVGYLVENLESYKDAMDTLKLKLEVNAQRMFDRSIGFSDRRADLQVIQDSANMAVDKAEATTGAHENQLDNLYQQTFVMWDAVTKAYEEVENTKVEVQEAQDRVNQGMIAYKRRRRFLSLLDFASISINAMNGRVDVKNNKTSLDEYIFGTVQDVGDFLSSWNGHEDEIKNMLKSVNEMMGQVNAIVALAPPDPPTSGDLALWLNDFKDTEQIVALATNQTVAQLQWQGIRDTCNLVLSDEELSDAVDGVRQLKLATYDLTIRSQSLSEHMVVFANLIISINQQVSVVENDKEAVASSQESLSQALDLINDATITEGNYLEYMVDQNIAIAKLMAQLYLKNRADLLAAFNVLGEYCQAFFYSFMSECPVQASYWDDFDSMFFKLKQLDVLALNAVGSLDPPPQPFTMEFSILDEAECNSVTDPGCPITQLAYTGRTQINLSEWWGPELEYTDRIRIDRIRLYLEGLERDEVTIAVTRPMKFNDTWHGEIHHFTGHATKCLIIYEDYGFSGIEDVNYITDCSTEHLFEEYYYRSTPYGIYELEVSEFTPQDNATELVSVEVLVEGSWIPRF